MKNGGKNKRVVFIILFSIDLDWMRNKKVKNKKHDEQEMAAKCQ